MIMILKSLLLVQRYNEWVVQVGVMLPSLGCLDEALSFIAEETARGVLRGREVVWMQVEMGG